MSSRFLGALALVTMALGLGAAAAGWSIKVTNEPPDGTERSDPSTPSEVDNSPAAARPIFEDNFDSGFDSTKWVRCHWWDDAGCTIATNHELEWYLPDDVLVDDGFLRLRAQRRRFTTPDGRVFRFTSGMVSTGRETSDVSAPPRFAFQHGVLEVRARMPIGRGLWPAIWMLPVSNESLPEIDVLEAHGQRPSTVRMRLHHTDSSGAVADPGEKWDGLQDPGDWHTFALEWAPETAVWKVDGIERWRVEGEAVPDEPMYLVINLAVGGDGPGPPDSSTVFPSYFDIDFVRVWKDSP